jgi:hypothetical protein
MAESEGQLIQRLFLELGMVVRCLLIETSIFLFRSRLEVKTLFRVNALYEWLNC